MPVSASRSKLVMTYYKKRRRKYGAKSNQSLKDGKAQQTKQQQSLVCRLCLSSEVNELDLGELITKGDITVHYFCVLLGSGLYQNGRLSNKKAIKGFLRQDILREAKRGGRLRCCFCREKGATIGCCMSACKRVFHLPCGRAHGTLHQFFDTFGSYCEHHWPEQNVSVSDRLSFRGTGKATCAICLFAVEARSSTKTVRSPCCKNSWFHRLCIQKYAVSAGQYFFKCPVCASFRNFQTEMLNCGIYIPVQDASWERQPDAFSELLERHSRCDANECKCPEGRNHDAEKGKFYLILCAFCGSFGSHKACHGLIKVGKYLLCPVCSGDSDSDMNNTGIDVPLQEECESRPLMETNNIRPVLRPQTSMNNIGTDVPLQEEIESRSLMETSSIGPVLRLRSRTNMNNTCTDVPLQEEIESRPMMEINSNGPVLRPRTRLLQTQQFSSCPS